MERRAELAAAGSNLELLVGQARVMCVSSNFQGGHGVGRSLDGGQLAEQESIRARRGGGGSRRFPFVLAGALAVTKTEQLCVGSSCGASIS